MDTKEISEAIERHIAGLDLPARPAGLYEPVRYALDGGGKRLRPLLCVQSCLACGGTEADAMDAALALEMFHNFTLVHDDIMDRSPMRRGRPSVAARYGENQAILSGDAMLALASRLAGRVPEAVAPRVLAEFNGMALRVYEGQQLDTEFESRKDVTLDEYFEMISLKTGALLAAACRIGAIIAGAGDATVDALGQYGMELGLAFQLRDDWLDTFGDAATFGKPIGGDINQAKKTFLYVSGMSANPEEVKALKMGMELPAGDMRVKTVTRIYEKLHLDEVCRKAAASYSAKALKAAKATGLPEERLDSFKYLLDRLSGRKK